MYASDIPEDMRILMAELKKAKTEREELKKDFEAEVEKAKKHLQTAIDLDTRLKKVSEERDSLREQVAASNNRVRELEQQVENLSKGDADSRRSIRNDGDSPPNP